MFTLLAELKAKEGKVDEAKAFLRTLAAQVKASEPGTRTYAVHQRKEDPRSFIVYEQYADEAAFQTHMANLAAHAAGFGDVLDGGPQVAFLEDL